MKVTKVSYDQLFPTGSYLNARIGFEAEISEDESPTDVISVLRNIAEEFHKAHYPHFYQNNQPFYIPQQPSEIQVERFDLEAIIDRLKIRIEEASTIEELKSYQIQVATYPVQLTPIYNKKMKELKVKK
jgi:hypothetical protein